MEKSRRRQFLRREKSEGKIEKTVRKKHIFEVNINRGEEAVFRGSFTCFVLETHVLSKNKKD
jgi:hypothetical protein